LGLNKGKRENKIKKTALIMLGMFILSSLSFAGEGKFDREHKKNDPQQKAKLESVKKERAEYSKNLDILIDKYHKASDKNKISVKKEIITIVTNRTNKDIAARKDRIYAQQKAIKKFESNKKSFINKKVDFLLSADRHDKYDSHAKINKTKQSHKTDKQNFQQHKADKKTK
jgi:hypothetical protein